MNILTLGTFDLFHYGHLILLNRCKHLAGDEGFVCVGLNTDEFIKKYKGRKPVMNFDERSYALNQCGSVDFILENKQEDGTIKDVIRECKFPEVIVVGSDWAKKDYLKQIGLDWEYLERHGISLCYVPYTESISTTEIKRRILEN